MLAKTAMIAVAQAGVGVLAGARLGSTVTAQSDKVVDSLKVGSAAVGLLVVSLDTTARAYPATHERVRTTFSRGQA